MQYDLVVIGAGPGGYVSAIRASQLGMKVALVEKYTTLGGTCLNVGCIPSKALLDSSEKFHESQHLFSEHGIIAKNVSVDFTQMVQRKNKVVQQTCDGVNFLMKKNKIQVYHGLGSFKDANTISIKKEKETIEIKAQNIIIATGSKPTSLPTLPFDKKKIISSTEALSLSEIPKKLIIVGGGIIGMEMASIYARIGSQVSVIEYLDCIVPSMDKDISKDLLKVMQKLGVTFYLQHKVESAKIKGKQVEITATDIKENKDMQIAGDYCLVAVGRTAFTENLNLESIGISCDEKNRIPVNEHKQTIHKHIYAIGDVIGGNMLAHKAEEEGVYVVERIAGQQPHFNEHLIPGVVYTWPEGASVGSTEDQLKSKNIAYKVGKFPFAASGRARASMDTDGFVKILADKETDEVLGVHILGPRAADLIAEAVLAMEYKASAEDIARICHAHPTFSEAIKEAALAATENRALHI